jgi:hypothetical protein
MLNQHFQPVNSALSLPPCFKEIGKQTRRFFCANAADHFGAVVYRRLRK